MTDKDWCHLLELCQVFNTLIADAENLYDLNRMDDQLVLGLLCGAPHKIPYVVQPAMSCSLRKSLSTRVFS